jgi:F0F1-type ATP synthase assembly protein I
MDWAMTPKSFDSKTLGKAMALSQVGLEMVAPIGLGYLADTWLGWLPVLTLVGVLVGLVGGMAHLLFLLRQTEKDDRNDPPGGRS